MSGARMELMELYYTVSLVADGMEPGTAKAAAALKTLEDAASRVGISLKQVGADAAASTAAIGGAVAEGARAAEQSAADAGRRIGTALGDGVASASPGRIAGEQLVDQLRTTLEAARADLARAVEAGLMTPAQAEAAGRVAGTQYVSGIRQGLAAIKTQGIPLADADLTAVYRKAATAIAPVATEATAAAAAVSKVGDAAETTAHGGLGTVERAFAAVVARVTGVNGSLARLVSTLGIMVEGAALTIGVTAALGAIGAAYEALTGKARTAKQKVDELIESMIRQRDLDQPQAAAAANIETLRKRMEADRAALETAKAPRPVAAGANGALFADFAQLADIDAKTKALARSTAAYNQAREEGVKAGQDEASELGELIAKHQASAAQLARAAELVAAYRRQLQTLTGADEESIRKKAALQAMIDSLTNAQNRQAKSATQLSEAQRAALEGFDAAIASYTPATADNLETQITKLVAAAKLAKLGTDQIDDKVKEIRAAAAEKLKAQGDALGRDLMKQLVAETGSQSLQLKEGLNDFNTNIAQQRIQGVPIDDDLVARVRAAKEESIKWAEGAERLQTIYQQIDDDIRLGGNLIADMARVDAELTQAEADRAAAQKRYDAGDPTAYRDIQNAQQRINSLTAEQGKLQDANAARLAKVNATEHSILDTMSSVAGQIANGANAAYGLASALGGADSAAAKLFGSVASIAGGISSASKLASAAGGFGNLLGSASGIVSLAGPVGAIVGGAISVGAALFGEDPKVKQARDQQNEAMHQLRDALLNLRDAYLQTVSSTDLAKDTAFVQKASQLVTSQNVFGQQSINGTAILGAGVGNGPGRRGGLRAIAEALGFNFDDGTFSQYLAELDQRYGTNLGSFVQNEDPAGLLKALQTLPDAFKAATAQLGGFGDDVAGIINRVAFQFQLLGNTDAAQKVRATVQALEAAGKSFGEFQTQIDQLTSGNLTDTERQAILDSISQRLGTGTNLNLGDLTGEQLRQLVLDASSAATGAASGTGGFNVDRTITEVTGSRIGALLSTGNVFAERGALGSERTAAAAESILARLGGSPIPAIAPPVMPSVGIDGGALTISGDVTVHVVLTGNSSGLSPTDASGIADATRVAVKDALKDPRTIAQISQKLKADQNWAARSQGVLSS